MKEEFDNVFALQQPLVKQIQALYLKMAEIQTYRTVQYWTRRTISHLAGCIYTRGTPLCKGHLLN